MNYNLLSYAASLWTKLFTDTQILYIGIFYLAGIFITPRIEGEVKISSVTKWYFVALIHEKTFLFGAVPA